MTNGLPKAIITDLDGTIALLNGRNPYNPKTVMNDKVNEPIADILKTYHKNTEVTIFIVTGRYERYKKETKKWLKKNKLDFYEKLIMRANKDKRADYNLKTEIYENEFKGKYDILFVLDDRDQAVETWREIGLTCLQVAEGDF